MPGTGTTRLSPDEMRQELIRLGLLQPQGNQWSGIKLPGSEGTLGGTALQGQDYTQNFSGAEMDSGIPADVGGGGGAGMAQIGQMGQGLLGAGLSGHPDNKSQNQMMGAAGGAMSGAQMGSMFGPWGTAIGAVVGGVGGAVMSSQNKKSDSEREMEKQMRIQTKQMKSDYAAGQSRKIQGAGSLARLVMSSFA